MSWAAAIGSTLETAAPILGGVAAYQQSRAQAATYREMGKAVASERKREASALLGHQRVAFAKSGVDVGTGTPLDIGAATAAQEALAVQRIKAAYEREADLSKQQGDALLFASILQGASSALGAFGQYGSAGSTGKLGAAARKP